MENTFNNILYPFLFEPNLHEIVWGGEKLTAWKGLPAKDHIGESWEVSCVESSPSIIANGMWAGHTLKEVISKHPEDILGREVNRQYHGELPLLVKFIDAQKDLSIQVHPDDEMARRLHEDYKRKVADGTIVESLAKHEVKAGDVFYLPAGRVHAICSGILLAEVQQSSDVTYRIFDYNRPGLDGKPRELHTELAAEALNYQVEADYRTDYSTLTNRANSVIDSPFFSVRVTEFHDSFHRNLIKYDSFIISMCLKGDCRIKIRSFHRNLIKYDSFIISMCLKGDCRIKIRATGDEILLHEGFSCLIPASIADYDITPLYGQSKVLDAYINNMDEDLLHKVSRFLHISTR